MGSIHSTVPSVVVYLQRADDDKLRVEFASDRPIDWRAVWLPSPDRPEAEACRRLLNRAAEGDHHPDLVETAYVREWSVSEALELLLEQVAGDTAGSGCDDVNRVIRVARASMDNRSTLSDPGF